MVDHPEKILRFTLQNTKYFGDLQYLMHGLYQNINRFKSTS